MERMAQDCTRRTFIKGAAGVGGAAALGALAASRAFAAEAEDEEGEESAEDESAEEAEEVSGSDAQDNTAMSTTVLVIGGGIAGTSAAIEAAEQGLDVILAEKNSATGGTSLVCDGAFLAAGTDMMEENGVDFSETDLYEYMKALDPSSTTDTDIMYRYAYNTASGYRFLVDHGVEFTELGSPRNDLPAVSHYTEGGWKVMRTLSAVMDEMDNIDVQTSLEITELVLDEDGAVVGAKGTQNDQEVSITADAVILATGGFAADSTMVAKHLSPYLQEYSTSNSNTGSGYKLALAAGATMMDTDMSITTSSDTSGENWVGAYNSDLFYVTGEGRRYCDESISTFDRAYILLARGIGSEYIIATEEQYEVYADDFDAAEADGRSFVSDDPRELAEMMGIDPDTLEETINRYNELCDLGEDSDFGKDPQYLTKLEGTLHSLACSFDTSDTASGPKINKNAQVIGANNLPIEGLYAAGAVSMAQLMSHTYLGTGASMMNGVVFGRTAAQHIKLMQDLNA